VRTVLLDTGPLVALLDRRDRYHEWAKTRLAEVRPPLHTCEAVLTEACFLLRRLPGGPQAVLDLVHRGLLTVHFSVQDEAASIQKLLMRYADLPIDLADACLVRLAELTRGSVVLTLDSDFTVYRIRGRSPIPVLMPDRP
jgi:uncharacterized protein